MDTASDVRCDRSHYGAFMIHLRITSITLKFVEASSFRYPIGPAVICKELVCLIYSGFTNKTTNENVTASYCFLFEEDSQVLQVLKR